jgi:hypothetical protein
MKIELVCIKDHSKKIVKSGQIFELSGLKKLDCCGKQIVDVGIKTEYTHIRCHCGENHTTNGIRWVAASLFAPLEYNQDEINSLVETLKEKA